MPASLAVSLLGWPRSIGDRRPDSETGAPRQVFFEKEARDMTRHHPNNDAASAHGPREKAQTVSALCQRKAEHRHTLLS